MPSTKVNDVYDDLLKYYISQGQPISNLKESKELVKVRFSEEEARAAMQLPSWYKPGGITSKEVAEKLGADAVEMEELLDRKANEGAIYARENKETEEVLYSLWDFGRLSSMYQPGRTDDLFLKVKELREKLWKGGVVHRNFSPSGYPRARVIPYHKGIAEGEEITPTDTVEFTLDQARSIAIAGCPCRVLDQRCDFEVMTCVQFNDMADYFVNYQGGSYISKEECKELIEKNVEDGLVATLSNYQSIGYGF